MVGRQAVIMNPFEFPVFISGRLTRRDRCGHTSVRPMNSFTYSKPFHDPSASVSPSLSLSRQLELEFHLEASLTESRSGQ